MEVTVAWRLPGGGGGAVVIISTTPQLCRRHLDLIEECMLAYGKAHTTVAKDEGKDIGDGKESFQPPSFH